MSSVPNEMPNSAPISEASPSETSKSAASEVTVLSQNVSSNASTDVVPPVPGGYLGSTSGNFDDYIPQVAPVASRMLARALGDPNHWSLQLPSIGTAGHRFGQCRPCPFYLKKQCKAGHECQQCHDPDHSNVKVRL